MRTVLVVDDTSAMQRFLAEVFVRNGDRVEVAGNGIEAIAKIRRKPFDVVIMDLQMPLMNGFQAAIAIRLMPDETRSSIPIVAISAHSEPTLAVSCIDAVMDDLLLKPLTAEVLLQSVERIAVRSRQRDQWKLLHPDYIPQAKAFAESLGGRNPSSHEPTDPSRFIEKKSFYDNNFDSLRQQTMHQRPHEPRPSQNRSREEWSENPEWRNRELQESTPRFSSEMSDRQSQSETLTTSQQLFDAERVMRNLGVDRKLLMMLAGFFIESVPPMLQDLTTATKHQNAADMQRIAHSLRGLAATFSPPEVLDLARKIEIAAQNDDIEEATALLPALHQGLAQLTTELQSYRQSELDDSQS
jgi:CheY-like chemotaxis protein